MGISVCGLIFSVIVASLMPSFILFVFFHNFLYGIFAGPLFLTPMKECQKYFPKIKLIINGLVLVGTGLGGEIFGVFNTRCMNPDLLSPTSSGFYSGYVDFISYRVPFCIRNMSWLILIFATFGFLCLWRLI